MLPIGKGADRKTFIIRRRRATDNPAVTEAIEEFLKVWATNSATNQREALTVRVLSPIRPSASSHVPVSQRSGPSAVRDKIKRVIKGSTPGSSSLTANALQRDYLRPFPQSFNSPQPLYELEATGVSVAEADSNPVHELANNARGLSIASTSSDNAVPPFIFVPESHKSP